MLSKPKNVRDDLWKRLLDKMEEISSREGVKHDICLIGSQARGDASPISDIDSIMFTERESNLKQTELFYLNKTSITIFPVDVTGLLKAESIDFYNANNPFEARLIHGDGRALDKLREEAEKRIKTLLGVARPKHGGNLERQGRMRQSA